MTNEFPEQFNGAFPHDKELRASACKHLKTRQQLTEEWLRKKAGILMQRIGSLDSVPLPIVLLNIVFEYIVSLTVVDDPVTNNSNHTDVMQQEEESSTVLHSDVQPLARTVDPSTSSSNQLGDMQQGEIIYSDTFGYSTIDKNR